MAGFEMVASDSGPRFPIAPGGVIVYRLGRGMFDTYENGPRYWRIGIRGGHVVEALARNGIRPRRGAGRHASKSGDKIR